MNQKDFNKTLKDFGKIILPILIPTLGLKKKHEKVLIEFYVNEKSYYDICEEMNMTRESIGNLICLAKKEFKRKLDKQKNLLPLEVIPYLDLFNEKEE